jgi:hypothetical protein
VNVYLMLTGSGDIADRCDRLEIQVMEVITALVGEREYGGTLTSIGVNVVLQDTGMIKLATRVFRKRKEAAVDVELSRQWAKNATDAEIRFALLQSVKKAVGLVNERLTEAEDDFHAQALIADLGELTNQICADQPELCERVIEETERPSSGTRVESEGRDTLIVQYLTEGWGSPDDLQMRHKIESLLDKRLAATGNGYCDGGDIGSGTINIFLSVLDAQRAAKVVIKALRKTHLLEGATIALETEEGFEVLWPQDFVGEFSYSY